MERVECMDVNAAVDDASSILRAVTDKLIEKGLDNKKIVELLCMVSVLITHAMIYEMDEEGRATYYAKFIRMVESVPV